MILTIIILLIILIILITLVTIVIMKPPEERRTPDRIPFRGFVHRTRNNDI